MGSAGAETWRCFVGLALPQEHRQALTREAARLARALASRISWTGPDNWHLTLRFLGGVEAARMGGLRAALSGVRFAPFALRLGAAGSFPPPGRGAPRVLWAGLERGGAECARLAADLGRALEPLGFAPEDRPLRPHVTLGRVRQPAPGDDWSAALAGVDLGGLSEVPVSGLTLWRSRLGSGGARHEPLAVFPAALG